MQPGLDLNRVGTVGLSLGGYYVPRALAYEPRVRAAVAVTGVYSFPPWSDISDMLRDILSLRCGGAREAQEFAQRVNLEDVASRITQPLLVVGGNADPVVAPDDARRLAREAPNAELLELHQGDHLGANRRWEWQARMADWMVSQLRR
jgi:dipeptidyl aminopeptidase/acylaminoacyl peptidase